MRKEQLVEGQYYHIFSRSIAGFHIFNDKHDYERMSELMFLCQFSDFEYRYSHFVLLSRERKNEIIRSLRENSPKLVDIVAYCLMPTHPHLILKQISKDGIYLYVKRVFDSYSKYFNIRHGRRGPLWEGRFKNVLVKTDEQLLHLTRYIHLNAVTAKLVEKPEEWLYSSYKEYIIPEENNTNICEFKDILTIEPEIYKKFVEDQIGYQRDLALIKQILIDDYTG